METKKIFIAGSTGSIGIQALNVCREHNINVVTISANENYELLCKQAIEFGVKNVHINNEKYYKILKSMLPENIKLYCKTSGLLELIENDTESDTFLNAIMGSAGLLPTLKAIEMKKKIALANKETIVCAGKIVMEKAKENKVDILPVDSEHSAIFQCLQGNLDNEVKKIILTASGGPFFGCTNLNNITVKDALNHPNWSMGKKITVDSATLMNKGLEVIEAYHLFNHKPIEVVVHPQSIIHSMVEFCDNAIIAQLGMADMTIPIQLALTFPKRLHSTAKSINFETLSSLTFAKPDTNTFLCLPLAYEALKIGGTMPCVLNSANEIAVWAFLNQKIKFSQIPDIVSKTMSKFNTIINYSLSDIIEYDKFAREIAVSLI